jgi:Leucine-rich repeat (LRR) protein
LNCRGCEIVEEGGTSLFSYRVLGTFKMTRISIFRNMLEYQKGWTPEFVRDVIQQQKIDGLRIFDLNRPLDSLDFLTEFDFLEKLSISCLFDLDYTFLKKLSRLTSLDISPSAKIGKTIDLSHLTELLDLHIHWRKGKIVGLQNCKKLESFSARIFNEADLQSIGQCTNLRSIKLSDSSIKSLEGISNLQKLEHLDLGLCGRLTSIEEINQVSSLRSLVFQNCPNVRDFGAVAGLKNLRSLDISACKGINSIKFADELEQLEELTMRQNTLVLDNDLMPARRIKKLIYVLHKSYNITILANELAEVESEEQAVMNWILTGEGDEPKYPS